MNYYGNVMGARIPPLRTLHLAAKETNVFSMSSDKKVCICGALCTAADILVREISLSDLQIGDALIFEKVLIL